jgi:DNA-binding response OmpR family regulator
MMNSTRVLIVDDDKSIADLIGMRLGVQGFETRCAHDGLIALARVRDFRPHAMILDINMPMMDGFGLMARLGAEKLAKLPTLVLTARHRAEDVKQAISLGARDYLAKPFGDAQLLSRVARLLR